MPNRETREPASRHRHGERIALIALLATVAAVFWRYLFTSDVLFYRDISSFIFPNAVELRELVRSGQWPLWNALEHFGEPVSANPLYLLFYPTTWLVWILPAAYALKLHFALHSFLAAAGSFLLARQIGLAPRFCYVAGALFVFSGPFMSLGGFSNSAAAAWIPLVILAGDCAVTRGGWRALALLAVSFALQFLAGSPEMGLITLLLLAAWCLTWYGFTRPVLTRLAFGLALAAGLCSVQAFPTLFHLLSTQRAAHLSYDMAYAWSFHPLKFFDLLFPNFWGNPLSPEGAPWVYVIEGREPLLPSVFIGILPLAFALVALASAAVRAGPDGSGAMSRASRFWAVAAMIALLIALGRFTALGYVFYYLVPLFRVIRYPVKFLIPATLAVAQLAAIGAQSVLTAPSAKRTAWVRASLAGFAALWLVIAAAAFTPPGRALVRRFTAAFFNPARVLELRDWISVPRSPAVQAATVWLLSQIAGTLPYVLGATVLMLVLLESRRVSATLRARVLFVALAAAVVQLIAVHYHLNPLVDHRFFSTRPPVMQYLKTGDPPVRVFAEPVWDMTDLPPASLRADLGAVNFLPPLAYESYSQRLSLQIAAGLNGVQTGFTPDVANLLAGPQHALTELVVNYRVRYQPLARLLRVAGFEYALYRRMPGVEGLEWLGPAPNASNIPVQVFRVRDPLPHAYVVAEATALPAGIETIHRLVSPDFDPAREVVLDASQTPAASGAAPASSSQRASAALLSDSSMPGEAKIVRRTATTVEIEARPASAGYLVFNESYDPEWRVTVDGRVGRLLRANQMFRAVALPAGGHRVVFEYRPEPLYVGAGITLATALLLALGLVISAARRAERARQASSPAR